jgi:iron-sulfur cluster repair protein YtfE (RIC family)
MNMRRHLVAVAGGLAMGVLGSRLLPPVLAAAAGSMSTRLGEDPFERLKADHRDILGILGRMQDAGQSSRPRLAALFLSLKRTLGKHALAEEDVVYPVLHAQAGAEEAAKRLYAEHGDIKIHLYAIEQALKDGGGWAPHVQALQTLVARHIQDEELVEFPRLQRSLGADRSRTLAGQIRREEAMLL